MLFSVIERQLTSSDVESILPNFDFFIFSIFTIKLGHFKVQQIFSNAQTLKFNSKKQKKLHFTKKKVW
jgi:hypothetical protein